MTPSIAEDIEMLANFWLEEKTYEQYSFSEIRRMITAAERVENYLSTFKPDHL